MSQAYPKSYNTYHVLLQLQSKKTPNKISIKHQTSMNIANNEESFIALIQKVFTKEFTKQTKHMTNRISSNLSITN